MISKGRHGVRGFVRKSDSYHHHSSEGATEKHGEEEEEERESDVVSVTSSLAGTGKPWKRHNNRNRKEKTRRTARPLNPNQ